MLVFSTILPVSENLTTEKFIDLVSEWVLDKKRKHTFDDFIWDGSPTFSVRSRSGESELIIQNCAEIQSVAIRYKITFPYVESIIDYVLSDKMLSIQMHQSLTGEAPNFFNFRMPSIIETLIERGYTGKDNGLQVSNEPLYLYNKDTRRVSSLYEQPCKYKLPVVYITKNAEGTYNADIEKLADILAGIAHVWAEKSPTISKKLNGQIIDTKPSFGEVQIYFTDGYAKRLPLNEIKNIGNLEIEIREEILRQNIRFKIDEKYQYHYIAQSVLQYEKQRIKIENETENKKICIRHAEDINKVFEMCDALEKERDRLLEENKRLQTEINDYKYTSMSLQEQTDAYSKKLNEMLDNNNVPLLYYGEETDLYQSEQLDILVDILTDVLDKNIEKSSRRRDVLESILKRNKSSGNLKERARVLERVLKEPKLNAQDKTDLRKADIYLSAENNHYKFQLANDPRYCVVIAKTLGDKGRGNKNATATIKKKFF